MKQSYKIQIKGLDLQIHERPGNKISLVFLHGNSMSSKIWEKQIESTQLDDYRIILIELPGHGDSSRSLHPEKDYTIPGYSMFIQKILDQLQLKEYVLVGLSLGGNIFIESLPYLDQDKCRGIILIGTSIVGKPAELEKAFLPNPALGIFFKGVATNEEAEEWTHSFFSKTEHVNIPSFIFDDFFLTDPSCRDILGNSVATGNYADEIGILQQKLKIPLAIMAGENEQLVNVQYLKELDVPKWKGEVHFIPEAGHIPQWENSRYFNEILNDFIIDCLT